jgi:hypothetical protein
MAESAAVMNLKRLLGASANLLKNYLQTRLPYTASEGVVFGVQFEASVDCRLSTVFLTFETVPAVNVVLNVQD